MNAAAELTLDIEIARITAEVAARPQTIVDAIARFRDVTPNSGGELDSLPVLRTCMERYLLHTKHSANLKRALKRSNLERSIVEAQVAQAIANRAIVQEALDVFVAHGVPASSY